MPDARRTSPAHRRVPRRRHGDERARRATRCELTEVGAVLVGGGELHERWSSLVGVAQPLGARHPALHRHLAGDGRRRAAARAACCPSSPQQLRGPRARRAQRALRHARAAPGVRARRRSTWPDPPVLCTVALARRLAPLQRRRGLAALADALGIEVDAVHRALPDAETCARVFCALFPKLCAHAATIGEALALLRRAARRRAAAASVAPSAARATPRPDISRAARRTRASTSSATPTAARCTSASRSACGRGRARTSRRRASGRARPSTSTTNPRTPSSARSCSRTG